MGLGGVARIADAGDGLSHAHLIPGLKLQAAVLQVGEDYLGPLACQDVVVAGDVDGIGIGRGLIGQPVHSREHLTITGGVNGRAKNDVAVRVGGIKPAGAEAGRIEGDDIQGVLLGGVAVMVVDQRAVAALADIIPAVLEGAGEVHRFSREEKAAQGQAQEEQEDSQDEELPQDTGPWCTAVSAEKRQVTLPPVGTGGYDKEEGQENPAQVKAEPVPPAGEEDVEDESSGVQGLKKPVKFAFLSSSPQGIEEVDGD